MPIREKYGRGRQLVMATHGMVSSGHYLASLSGLKVLQRGGNAVDAAIATAATLTVVRPHMCGIGGDGFMLYYDQRTNRLMALNGSGRAPYSSTADFFIEKGLKTIPKRGILSTSIPGLVDLWDQAMEKQGTMGLSDVLEDAIQYAEGGFPMYPSLYKELMGKEFQDLASREPLLGATFSVDGKLPQPGDVIRFPHLASVLKKIAKGGRDIYYKGEIAEKIVDFVKQGGGLFSERDFADQHSTWTEAIKVNYRGYDIIAFPPNTQGVGLLEQLNLHETFDLQSLCCDSADYLHLMIEIKKLVFEDVLKYVGDPDFVNIPLERMLSKDYAMELKGRIDLKRARERYRPPEENEEKGDTTYLCVVDREGNCVSLILSLYEFFGSGVVVKDTGIILHNRGSGFSLHYGHANRIAPHKRPFHTLCPAMILKNNKPYLVYGTPGAFGQTQTLVQVTNNLLVFGLDLQESIEIPRFRHTNGLEIFIEHGLEQNVYEELKLRGHHIKMIPHWDATCGGVEAILIHQKNGVLMGAADPRRDGVALGF